MPAGAGRATADRLGRGGVRRCSPPRRADRRIDAVASAEAAGDHTVGEPVRAAWSRWWDSAHIALGSDTAHTTSFLAYGMLINTLVSLGFPTGERFWAAFDQDLRNGFAGPER